MSAARISYRTLDRLVTNAARHTGRDDLLPVLKQIRLRRVAGAVEARATDRFTLGFFRAPLDNGQGWPDGLDLGLTARQWRTVLATMRGERGGHLDDLLEFLMSDDGATVTVSRYSPDGHPRPPAGGADDTVGALTLTIPRGEYPKLDHLAKLDAAKLAPLGPTAIDGKLLARLPREFGLIVAPAIPATGSGPVHIVAPDWHVVVMSVRLAETWRTGPAATIPSNWLAPAPDKEPA